MRTGFFILLSFFSLSCGGQSFFYRHEPLLAEGGVREITLLFQSSDHLIWLGTDKGLFSYDGRKYKSAQRPDQKKSKVTAIAEHPEGQIWAGYNDGYIHLINLDGQNKTILSDSLEGASVSNILFSPASGTFITTYGKGIWRIVDGKLRRLRYEMLASIDDIYDALFDVKGRLWLATDNGIWVYHPGQQETLLHLHRQNGLPDEIVTQLEEDKNGDIWIGLYDHGLARYQFFNDSIVPLLPPDPISQNITGLVKGRPGEVWFSTEKSIGHYSFSRHQQRIGLPDEFDNRVGNLLFDQNGMLWVTMGNKIATTNTRFEYWTPGLNGIQAIGITNQKIWLGCERGLYAMDPAIGMILPSLEEEKINVLSLYTDPTGNLWIGTFGQGLYCLDSHAKKSLRLTEKDGLSNNSILNIDGRGQSAWLATLGGITQLDWTRDPFANGIHVTTFLEKFNFPEGYVYDVYAADDGCVWFGTDGKGLYCLKGNEFTNLDIPSLSSAEEKQDLKTIYSITKGTDQSLWVSGSQGQIFQLDKAGHMLNRYQNAEAPIHSLVTSGESDVLMVREGGLEIINQWGELIAYGETSGMKLFAPNINALARETDGTIWMAEANKVWRYSPLASDSGQHVRIHLESVSPASLHLAEGAKLKPDSNFLDIRFTGLWYQDPGSVQYRYMLEGHDQEWIYTREGRAVYSRLSPGTYTFKVEGAHHDDFSNARTFQRSFLVLPPFYLRWWFVLGSAFIISWITFSYVLNRIKRIKKLHLLEKEKTMLRLHAIQAQVNPHFLFNSFNTLAGIIEEDQHAAVDYVDQLSAFFRGVLTHRNAELIRIEEEIELVRNYTFILQKRYGQNLVIEETIHQSAGWIAPLSIQLLVENAIKHNIVSKEKPLRISITVDKHWVTVSNPVQPKFTDSAESTGFGLSSLLARYQYLTRDNIEIRRTPDTFTVCIPIIYRSPGV